MREKMARNHATSELNVNEATDLIFRHVRGLIDESICTKAGSGEATNRLYRESFSHRLQKSYSRQPVRRVPIDDPRDCQPLWGPFGAALVPSSDVIFAACRHLLSRRKQPEGRISFSSRRILFFQRKAIHNASHLHIDYKHCVRVIGSSGMCK
jgi:hypothetical protein